MRKRMMTDNSRMDWMDGMGFHPHLEQALDGLRGNVGFPSAFIAVMAAPSKLAFFCIHAGCARQVSPYVRWTNLQRHNREEHSTDKQLFVDLSDRQAIPDKKLARFFHYTPASSLSGPRVIKPASLEELRDYEKGQEKAKVDCRTADLVQPAHRQSLYVARM